MRENIYFHLDVFRGLASEPVFSSPTCTLALYYVYMKAQIFLEEEQEGNDQTVLQFRVRESIAL